MIFRSDGYWRYRMPMDDGLSDAETNFSEKGEGHAGAICATLTINPRSGARYAIKMLNYFNDKT